MVPAGGAHGEVRAHAALAPVTCLHVATVEGIPSPAQLRAAAATAHSLAYVAGLAGVVAGGLLFRDGQAAFAAVVWVLTFAAGAILMIAAFLTRAMAGLMGRLTRIESDLRVLLADRGPTDRDHPRWSGHHPHA